MSVKNGVSPDRLLTVFIVVTQERQMALIMTHVRFALDMAERFSIQDMQRYISGTVYPDSRWVSGIDRALTHNARFRAPDFPTDDFTRGWQVHCVCDHVQNEIFEALFPQFLELPREEKWVRMSVAKLIQDMNDLQHFDLDRHLKQVTAVHNPNGEDIHLVSTFYEIIRRTYGHLRVPTPEEYRQLWLDVGLSEKLADGIIDQLHICLQNGRDVRRIEQVYPELCDQANRITL